MVKGSLADIIGCCFCALVIGIFIGFCIPKKHKDCFEVRNVEYCTE